MFRASLSACFAMFFLNKNTPLKVFPMDRQNLILQNNSIPTIMPMCRRRFGYCGLEVSIGMCRVGEF